MSREYKVREIFSQSRAGFAVQHNDVREARQRELNMKHWRRAWKIALIEKLNADWRDLTEELNF